jgi:choline dehydrogenase-like flavoprotein
LASRLAHTSSRPSVLLLEAGGPNDSLDKLSGDDRFRLAFSPGSPLNWGYKTQPQNQLSGQEIDYSRGRGLGGSTAINFCGWVVGPKDDYDEWARLVDDSSFCWENAKACLKRIENLHPEIPNQELKKYVDAIIEGKDRILLISFFTHHNLKTIVPQVLFTSPMALHRCQMLGIYSKQRSSRG